MKNPSSTRRPGNRPHKNSKRPQGSSMKPKSNSNNRNASRGQAANSIHPWAATSSQVLTSHLTVGNKRRADGQQKRSNSKNSNGKFSSKNKPRFRPGQTHPQQSHLNKMSADETSLQTPKPDSNGAAKTSAHNIDPFELFCAYHLGISGSNEYKPANINDVAKRFNANPAIIRQVLVEYGMDSDSVLNKDFDMALAQLDIQVAPEGINRKELARNLHEEFLSAEVIKRDWGKMLEEDRKENQKVFGGR